MSIYTGMQFNIRDEGFGDSLQVCCNSADGYISIIRLNANSQDDGSISIMYEEAKHLVRVLQHCLAMHGEP